MSEVDMDVKLKVGDENSQSKQMETDSQKCQDNSADEYSYEEEEQPPDEDEQKTSQDDLNGDQQSSKNSEADVTEPVRYYTKRKLKYQTPVSSLEPLPEGWVNIPHCSGIPFYLHKQSKVVTWSRPYVVSMSGIRRHNPPLASFPCLESLNNRVKFEKEVIKTKSSDNPNPSASEDKEVPSNTTVNGASDDTTDDENKTPENQKLDETVPKVFLHKCQNEHLDEKELIDYLDKRFVFDTVEVPLFNKWSDKRRYTRQKKQEANMSIQDNQSEPKKLGPAKVITLSVPREGGSERPHKVVFNTSIKPMVCVMHEYAQSVLRTQPHYVFATKEDSSEPFQATVMIENKEYGRASGINKKSAKNKAALATMEILVPGFKEQVDNLSGETSVEYFNDVSVTDPRVYDLCVHAGNYLPYQLLTECLKRNQGIADTSVHFDVQIGKGKNIEYKMECGKHVVNGTAKNKKIGKQMAAQQILQLLHPKVSSWGELIRMYGTSVAEKRAKKKNIEQEIFELKQRRSTVADSSLDDSSAFTPKVDDSNATPRTSGKGRETRETPGPNPELLAKLRKMMEDLGEARHPEVNVDRSKKDNAEGENEQEPDKKRRKLLLIDV
uniref:Microprocessor complex subunit DGCR8 n=1 Tax=Phallusia mammillata TaxID=59560 RepID=A0A6F9DAP9_9ASCI|nr:microprocessor complex subunit DGCR8 [Phallusia mammillata]